VSELWLYAASDFTQTRTGLIYLTVHLKC